MSGARRLTAGRLARSAVAVGIRRGLYGPIGTAEAAAAMYLRTVASGSALRHFSGGSKWRAGQPRPRPSPQVVRAMRERSEQRDPQMQQRRQRLPSGYHHYYATCHPGLEAVVAAELAGPAIRATDVQPGKAGVSFTGDVATGYRANLWLRSAIRVLMLLQDTVLDGRRPAGEEVYNAFRDSVNWGRLLAPGQTFSVEGRVWSCSDLTSSQLLQVRARDAVCDAIRDQRGAKPVPPERGSVADVPLFCTAYHDRLTIYRDMSGDSLHRRGYRQAMHRASLNESAAAGILYMAGWHQLCKRGGAVLADPMCGSGTFLIEAALMATNTAPGSFRRRWPFMQWRDSFDREAWAAAVEDAAAARHPPPPGVEVWGNDVHQGALGLALGDVQAAGMGRMVRLHQGECRDWQLPRRPTVVVSNPPWGQRLRGREAPPADGHGDSYDSSAAAGRAEYSGGVGGSTSDLEWWDREDEPEEQQAARRQGEAGRGSARRGLREDRDFPPAAAAAEDDAEALRSTWWDLSSFLKRQCAGATAYLLSGSPEATQGLRMKADRRHPITVGGVDCRLLQYSIRGVDGQQPAAAGAADGAEQQEGRAAAAAGVRVEDQKHAAAQDGSSSGRRATGGPREGGGGGRDADGRREGSRGRRPAAGRGPRPGASRGPW